MKSWEINQENLDRWSSECTDMSDTSTYRSATYWRNVAFVLLRYVLTGADGTEDSEEPLSPLLSAALSASRSFHLRWSALRGARTSSGSKGS